MDGAQHVSLKDRVSLIMEVVYFFLHVSSTWAYCLSQMMPLQGSISKMSDIGMFVQIFQYESYSH